MTHIEQLRVFCSWAEQAAHSDAAAADCAACCCSSLVLGLRVRGSRWRVDYVLGAVAVDLKEEGERGSRW